MLIEKYRPKKIGDIIGQRDIIRKIDDWLKNWKRGKALLLYGPTGIGKNIIIEMIANEKNMNILEINAIDDRKASSIRDFLGSVVKDGSLFKKRLILINEADGLSGADRGGIAEIIKIIKDSVYPVMLTADNAYNSKLRTLRRYCELIRVKKIAKNLIEKKLIEIVEKENLKISLDTIRKIAMSSNGDIRSAINDLEIASKGMGTIGYRETEKSIFETLAIIFGSQDLKTVLQTIRQCEKNVDEIFWWLEQNICNVYKDPEEVAAAFDLLSKADLFKSKIIKNQNYRFKKYMIDMMAGISLVKKNPYRKFVMYKPPDRLVILGRTKSIRYRMNEIFQELGEYLHCSKRKVKEQLPYLEIMLGKNFMENM